MGIEQIINDLKKLRGLSNFRILTEEEKKEILELEDKNNFGVIEALGRPVTIALSHDDTFREPAGEIVVRKGKKVIFPPLPFPEVKATGVVSGSPGTKVHFRLAKDMRLKENDATLLIGFRDSKLKEVSDAVKEAGSEDISAVIETKKKGSGKKFPVYHQPTPGLSVNYAQLFSYLNTRPVQVDYSYEIPGFKKEKSDEEPLVDYSLMVKIVKARRMDQLLHGIESKRDHLMIEGDNPLDFEQYQIIKKISFVFAMNQVLYAMAFY